MLSTPAYISSVSNCLAQLDCWLALRPKRSMMCHTDSSNLLVLARCIIHSLWDTVFFPDAVRRNTKSQREPTIKTLFEFYCTVGEESLPYMHYADMNPHSSKLYYILQICGIRVREKVLPNNTVARCIYYMYQPSRFPFRYYVFLYSILRICLQ